MVEKDTFLDPVLLLEPITAAFNPEAIPTNGTEYLQHVHYEAKMCDQVVVANIDVKKFKNKVTANFTTLPIINTECSELLPSLQWQHEKIADFSEVRQAVERRRIVQSRHLSLECFMPVIDSRKRWYQFCVGQYRSANSFTGREEENTELRKSDESEEDMPQSVDQTDVAVSNQEPHLHLLAVMSQVVVIKVLDYHIEWLRDETTDFLHSGPWIYALLACLEIPLTPETCSSIRSLARLAAAKRLTLSSKVDESLDTLNLFICLVGRYFRQFDLADM